MGQVLSRLKAGGVLDVLPTAIEKRQPQHFIGGDRTDGHTQRHAEGMLQVGVGKMHILRRKTAGLEQRQKRGQAGQNKGAPSCAEVALAIGGDLIHFHTVV